MKGRDKVRKSNEGKCIDLDLLSWRESGEVMADIKLADITNLNKKIDLFSWFTQVNLLNIVVPY